jgi:hypothetical protein
MEQDELVQPFQTELPKQGPKTHYYGDQIRVLFVIAGILMLLGLPLFQDKIPFSVWFSVGAIIVLIFLAGLTNPKQVWVSFLNTAASLIGFAVFEYYALTNSISLFEGFFLVNQLLAIIFLIAFYLSSKTLRGFYLNSRK